MQQFEACILGAAGMGAGELLRYLLQHPLASIGQLVSRSQTGKSVGEVHPHLATLSARHFREELQVLVAASSEPLVIISSMGHGELAQLYPAMRETLARAEAKRRVLLIDLSADFRLNDAGAWQAYYESVHPCPQYLDEFIYGLPELNRSQLVDVTRIASPGCFATAINLGLLPIARHVNGRHIAISAMTGSSGSGNLPSAGTHHPHRAHDLRAYNMLRHRHQAELEMLLAGQGSSQARISFIPHSAPLVRGIFATLQIELDSAEQASEFANLYEDYYRAEPFVDVLQSSPRVATVAGSNRAELHAMARGRTLAVLVAIDNLGKGMAGQAIQSMNIALGLPETTGLLQPAVYP
jgi:N-acetyl-gamma-glutamyl-phosphate reductase